MSRFLGGMKLGWSQMGRPGRCEQPELDLYEDFERVSNEDFEVTPRKDFRLIPCEGLLSIPSAADSAVEMQDRASD